MPESGIRSQGPEIFRVETTEVSCDGTSGPMGVGGEPGHPLVYLAMDEEGQVTCPYCSRQFVLVEHP